MIIDINCDMGEWSGGDMHHDAVIMPFISSANIACGAHAGDLVSMEHTIRLAHKYGVCVGAHPGFPDREGFGRVGMKLSPHDLRASLHNQIMTIRNIATAMGISIRHVKPHGALYNMAAADPELARLITTLVAAIDNNLIIYGLPGSELEHAAKSQGLPFAGEVFADRAYRDDGSLLPRNLPGAVLNNVEEMARRVVTMITEGYVLSVSGRKIMVKPDTVCVHGDNPVAPALVKHLSKVLKEAGIRVGCR